MKNLLIAFLAVTLFAACKTTYKTSTSGLEYESSIQVVRDNSTEPMENILLVIDDVEYIIEEVYPEKKTIKAQKFYTKPGKHAVKVVAGQTILFEENVFLGNQETRKIILRK